MWMQNKLVNDIMNVIKAKKKRFLCIKVKVQGNLIWIYFESKHFAFLWALLESLFGICKRNIELSSKCNEFYLVKATRNFDSEDEVREQLMFLNIEWVGKKFW